MRYQGRVTNWNDDKGYGFVTPNGGGDKAFVHIKTFSSSRRPIEGDLITYEVEKDPQNRIRAVSIRYPGVPKTAPKRATPHYFGVILVTLFSCVVVALTVLGRTPLPVAFIYVIASCITLIVYAFDKSAAMNNRWRTQESTLHILSLVGGWPGALIAQRMFRHKTKKFEFQVLFWGSVVVNCGALAWSVSERGASFVRATLGTL